MNAEFKRLIKYNTLCIALKALVIGLSAGLLTAGILLVSVKMWTTDYKAIFCILGGVAAGLISGIVAFLLMRVNDKKVAEKLDEVHGLNERVQTMVEFSGETGTILTLQREDTERRLKSISSIRIKKGAIVAYALTLCLCIGVFVGGILVPAKAAPNGPGGPEDPFELTEWQKTALQELIVYVRGSAMQEEAKTQTVAKLEELLDALKKETSEQQMKIMVIEAIKHIYTVTDGVNSNNEIGEAMGMISNELGKPLSVMIGTLNNGAFNTQIENFRLAFEKEETLTALGSLTEEMRYALNSVSGFDSNDPLFAAVEKLIAAIEEVADNYAEHDMEWVKSKAGVLANDMKISVSAALEEQAITKSACNHTVKELVKIFGLSESEIPEDPDKPMDDGNKGDDDELTGGGIGKGDMKFASDDIVFDPDTGKFVAYGTIMNPYYNAMDEYIHSGKIPEELADFLSDYFQNLFAGMEETKD